MFSAVLAVSLVLMTLDTTRADYINEAHAPHLSSGPALRFSYAVSAATWTLPAHASIFTGRPPSKLKSLKLNIDRDTWIDLFDNPAAVVSVAFLDVFEKEFRVFDSPTPHKNVRSAMRTTDAALEIIEDHDFLWIHYWSPHEYGRNWARYANLIKEMDEEARRFLAHVPSNAWVVIISDHGEYGKGGHTDILHKDVTRVTFQIRGPGMDGIHDELISQLDVRAMVTSLLDGKLVIPSRELAITESKMTQRVWGSGGLVGDFPTKPHEILMDEQTLDQLRALGYIQ